MDVRVFASHHLTPTAHCSIGAGVPITSPQLYSAGHTEDYRVAMLYVKEKYPKAPLLGIGFSLGANVITRYVAEEGDKCRLVSAIALGCVRVRYRTHGPALTYTNTAMGSDPKCVVVRAMCPSFGLSLTICVGSRVAGSTARFIPRRWVATSNLSSGGTGNHWQSSKTTPSRQYWIRHSA